MERDSQPEETYEQLRLFEVGHTIEEYVGIIAVYHYGHVVEYDRYGPLGDVRSIAREGEW